MTIKRERKWNTEDLRQMCIRNDYCTRMSNEEYEDVFAVVRVAEPTYINIYHVAERIVKGSDLEGYAQTEVENIQSVMFNIEEDVVHTFFEIEE